MHPVKLTPWEVHYKFHIKVINNRITAKESETHVQYGTVRAATRILTACELGSETEILSV